MRNRILKSVMVLGMTAGVLALLSACGKSEERIIMQAKERQVTTGDQGHNSLLLCYLTSLGDPQIA